MKFGVNTWVWVSPTTADNLPELAAKAAGMGYDMVEIGIESVTDLDYGRGAAILREHGLGISVCAAMGPDRDLIHEDESIQASGIEYIRHCIDAAKTLGATNVAGPIYSAVGRVWQQTADEREQDMGVLVKHLKDLSAYAGDQGVVLCIEPLNRFETSFINLSKQAVELVDRVDHPACKILLDTFHMNIEEKSLGAAIRVAGSRIAHFHSCENDRGAPGTGHVPWDEVKQALNDVKYDGPVVIESFTSQVKTIARAAAIWRSFEPSQDALAENGLKYLKELLT
jgi:D-psicose/D-tagatose/L-ribulose 3-epimerase